MNVSFNFPRTAVLLAAVSLSLLCIPVVAGDLVVPVRVSASSNQGRADKLPTWHVETLRLGAQYFDPATGSNAPYGLVGYRAGLGSCVAHTERAASASRVIYPRHEHYREEPVQHPKSQGMWLSRSGDHEDAWIEFELPEVAGLGQIWIWNWNDGPETGRRVEQLTIQTSTTTTAAKRLGSVDYNVTHGTMTLPDIAQVRGRQPDLVYTFAPGTQSRYVRLHDMDNFGPDDQLGLAEVFIVGPGEPTAVRKATSLEAGIADGTPEPHWQLFLDDHIVTRSTGFRRVLHHPRPRGVVLEPDKPWETFGVTPWYVGRRKDGTFECYYQTLWRERGGRVVNRMAYAVSKDAIHWEKPVLNMIDGPDATDKQDRYRLGVSRGSSKANNILPCGHPRDLLLHGNVRDPERRFALGLNFSIPQRIAFCQELPDFVNDPDWLDKLTDSGGFIHSHYTTLEFWDDMHDEWVVMRQAPNHPPTRVSGRYASPDMKNWTLDHFFYPDAHDSTDPRHFDEVYGLMSTHLEGIVFGYAAWFTGDETHPTTEDKGLIGTNTSKGTMEVRLVTSRDGGKTWDRTVSREAWIPHGKEQDSYDRLVRLDCPPLRMGDEDWFYGTVYDADHAAGGGYGRRMPVIRGALYTQKHNRYASLTAGNRPRVLITKPIKVTGETLQLNVDASRGEVRVGIGSDKWLRHKTGAWKFKANLPHWIVEDRWGESHLEQGFGIADCDPVQRDCIEHNVTWKDARLEALLGQTVRLYIMVQDADLYGFRFR